MTKKQTQKDPNRPLDQDLIKALKEARAAHDPSDVPDLPVLDLDDRDFDTLAVALGPSTD